MQKGEQSTFFLTSVDNVDLSGAVYTSADSNVVSVTADGVATAKAAGTATVTATLYNGASADVTVQVLDNTGYEDKTTIADTDLMADSSWRTPKVCAVPAGSSVQQYGASADGRWRKVKFDGKFGWLYNKAFEEITNYTDFTLETLPRSSITSIRSRILPTRTTPPRISASIILRPTRAPATPMPPCCAICTTAAAAKPCG